MKKIIKAGATSQTIDLFIQSTAVTTGAGLTGLAYNTANLTAYYRKGATGSATAITLATQTVGGAYSSGGFVEIDATNMPGMYRLDLPNAVVDTAGSVSLMLKGAANMAQLPIELQVVAVNLEDGVRMGMTALPNAAADAAGGLPISDAGGLDLDAKLANTNEVTAARMGALTDWINGGRLDLILDDILLDTTDISAIKTKTDYLPSATAGAAGGVFIAGANAATSVTTALTANITGNLSGSVGSVTGAVGSVTGSVGSVTGNVGGNVAGSVGSVTAAVAITSNIKKNQALAGFTFLMTDSTNHAPATGLTVTVTRSIDGGVFAAGTLSAVTEVANGIYSVDFGAGDLNGKVVILQATAAASDTTFERIVTQV